ncbi:MAG: hypothetical protein QCH35_08470 [Methanomicrobiaceae archaeon]|nr:hypothetical protein [Methanomicrobiaceae archaeon]
MGWLGPVYLLLVLMTDLCIAYFCISLIRSGTVEEGRVQIRRLSLIW